MKYQEELTKAEEFVTLGRNLEAAKIYEEVGTKCLREEGVEREEAPKIISKSIARYLLAGEKIKAQDLAFQVMFMKEEHPFLALQVETAISSKKSIVRAYGVNTLPNELKENYFESLSSIPQNRKVLKINSAVTIKDMWEATIFGEYKRKFDLINQTYTAPKDLINDILAAYTGVIIIAAETASKKKLVIIIATTFNEIPLEIINLK